MYYAATQQMADARTMARAAEQQIKTRTGMSISIRLSPYDSSPRSPERILRVIAEALGMDASCFSVRSRRRDFSDLRFIASHILRQNFPKITLSQIAALFGGYDHSSIISGLARANSLLYIGDTCFADKYNTALKAVTVWLRREA
ncbi:MAG: helix-turn-helix domain-containing protein [Bacteroidota bacterium]